MIKMFIKSIKLYTLVFKVTLKSIEAAANIKVNLETVLTEITVI
jgi:hypothetical protein